MAWLQPPSYGKRRTRQHVIADLGINHVERFVLRCGWTIQRTTHDYGIDLLMETYNDAGEPETGRVLFQVKATDTLDLRERRQCAAIRLDRRDVQAWCREPMPVILIVYDAKSDKAYWLHVQGYFSARPRGQRTTTTVFLPTANLLTETAVHQFAELRDSVLSRIRRVIFYEE